MDFWDWEKNKERNIDPYSISEHCNKMVCWKCPIDKYEWEATPNHRSRGGQCPVCTGRKIGLPPEYKNSIWASKYKSFFEKYTTEEQMKNATPKGTKKIEVKCPDCGETKNVLPNNLLSRGLGCKCGDGISFPNKFIYEFLRQLNVFYISEYKPKWGKGKRFDIYCPDIGLIIENHGMQHYKDVWNKGRTLQDEQENDTFKKEIALEFGIKNYIVVDCSHSNVRWIKRSIMSSKLPEILSFKEENIDWDKCEERATKNKVKEMCLYYKEHSDIFVKDIAKMFNVHSETAGDWLKIGNKFGWCKYDGKAKAIESSQTLAQKYLSKPTLKLSRENSNNVLAIYKNAKDAENECKIGASNLRACCLGDRKSAGGYKWMYLEDTTRRSGDVVPGAISMNIITEEECLNLLKQKE